MLEYFDMTEPDFTAMDGETLLKTLHQYCVERGASDIHVSPQKDGVRLEWRVHGVLQQLALLTHACYADFLRRVKFEAKVKLNITNVPQDGQYTFMVVNGTEKRIVNIRVAVLPSRYGEALTLRVLDPRHGILPMSALGFPQDIAAALQELIQLPHGLVLVTGPTGSGKTTTLYALLSTVIGKERNIITLEDPVEYELPGIIQSQIDPAHDYTFASGLRSVLRHDPDVILVGEIRDTETAQTAVNAALTGHLVLSTLHTNSAIEAIPRLLSMGVSAYTLAPALRAILSQRLVRTLTPACKTSGTCDPGAHESYGGQIAIPELLQISPAIRDQILASAATTTIEAQARKEGFRTMRERGETLMAEKVTTQQEVLRVVE